MNEFVSVTCCAWYVCVFITHYPRSLLYCQGLLCAFGVYFIPSHADTFSVAFVASFATKLSDTFASELGTVFGTQAYHITSFKAVPRGTQGAVSAEGTTAGFVAAVIMTSFAQFIGILPGYTPSLSLHPVMPTSSQLWISSSPAVYSCLLAAFVATTVESIIGERFQNHITGLTNETVNIINTFVGAIVAIVYYELAKQ